jgi:D-mycarose 3-C-methyltransferase
MTGSVLSGMADLVASCEKRYGSLIGKTVLDIGCNDGSLLDFFKAKGCKTLGVEPTGAAHDSSHDTVKGFFDENTCNQILEKTKSIDFITFTNVFAHIEDLQSLIKNLRLLINKTTVLIIENHYLGSVLNTGQFDTFYHEHPRTYSVRSFEYIAENLGLKLTDFEFTTRYGGNVRVYLSNGVHVGKQIDESFYEAKFNDLAIDMSTWRLAARRLVDSLVKEHGKLRAKAFPGRAAILMKLLDLSENEICAVFEIKGSIKVWNYVPGTKIPILPEAELFKEQDLSRPIINFAWHIPSEVKDNLRKNGYLGEIINIKSLTN